MSKKKSNTNFSLRVIERPFVEWYRENVAENVPCGSGTGDDLREAFLAGAIWVAEAMKPKQQLNEPVLFGKAPR